MPKYCAESVKFLEASSFLLAFPSFMLRHRYDGILGLSFGAQMDSNGEQIKPVCALFEFEIFRKNMYQKSQNLDCLISHHMAYHILNSKLGLHGDGVPAGDGPGFPGIFKKDRTGRVWNWTGGTGLPCPRPRATLL